MTAKVSVWVDKFVTGWTGEEGSVPTAHPVVGIVEAMSARYKSDAHFAPYRLVTEEGVDLPDCPRIKIETLPHLADYGVRVAFDVAVADIDHPDVHAGRLATPPDEWRDEMWRKVRTASPDALVYDTRGGMRVIVALPNVMGVQEYQSWSRRFRQYLRGHGLPVDEIDAWSQCYRLPFVVRDGVPQNPTRHDIREPAVCTFASVVPDQGVAAGIEIDPRQPFKLPRRIPEGQRHQTLVRYAAQLRWQGLDEEGIATQLRQVNQERCRPAAPDTEIAEIAHWAAAQEDGQRARQAAAGREPRAPVDPADPDDVAEEEEPLLLGDQTEIAQRIADKLGKHSPVPLVSDLGNIYRFDPKSGYWRVVDNWVIEKMVHAFSGVDVRDVGANGNVVWRPMRINDSTVVGTVKSLHRLLASPEFFASAPAGIAFSDCWVRVTPEGIEKHPHDPSQRARSGYDFAWTEEEPQYWHAMLHDYWGHKAEYEDYCAILNEFVGASLCGIATRFQSCVTLVGRGSNGKSSILTVVKGIFPDGTVTSVSAQMFGSESYRAMLAGAKLNVVGELPEKKIRQEAAAALKALVSGDEIVAKELYKNPFKFKPVAGHIVACNALPDVEDDSDGLFRRFKLLMLDKQFSPTGESRDIGDQVLEADRAKIVCYCLRSVPELMRRGKYLSPKESVDELTAWRNGQDEIALFLEDRTEPCEPMRGNGTDGESLYNSYAVWAPQNGYIAMNKNRFLAAVDRRRKRFYDNERARRMYPVHLIR